MRAIVSSFSTMTTPAIIHDSKFYLQDGDLAICSSSSQEGPVTIFRIHKPVMLYNSPVFRSMFDLPVAPEGQEKHDGVPIVRVTDSAEELRALLNALYDPG